METCKYGLGAGARKPTAEKPQGVLSRAYVLAKAATSSTWQPNCISPQTCAISCVASPTAILCHRCRQSHPLLLRDTLRRVLRGLKSCHWNTAHLSHTSKSVVFRHTSQRRTARKLITASTVSLILPWHLRM